MCVCVSEPLGFVASVHAQSLGFLLSAFVVFSVEGYALTQPKMQENIIYQNRLFGYVH